MFQAPMAPIPLKAVFSKLQELYTPPATFLRWKTPLDLLVATILSAQCTDAQVNKITPALFAKYRTPKDYLSVPQSELEQDIRSCGTFRRKAEHLRRLSEMLLRDFDGKVPDSMEDLTKLPGVGRKTAAIVLSVAFGKVEGIAVDTHVLRVSRRLGLTRHGDPAKVEEDLMEALPRAFWSKITTLLISHGRAVCTAKNRKCDLCIFREKCPSSKVMGRKDLARIDHGSGRK